MNKKIVSILFAFVLCFCMVLPAFAVTDSTEINGFADEYSRVIDYAGVIPQQEEDKLVEQFDEIANRQKVDIVICFTNSLDGKRTSDYAEALYEKYNYGYGENKDGIMLLVSFENRDWYIATRGYAIQAFTDAGIQYIGNQIKGDLGEENYYAAAEYFGRLCDEFITDAKNGNVYDKPMGAVDDEDDGTRTHKAIKLTDEGQQFCEKYILPLINAEQDVYSTMTDKQIEEYVSVKENEYKLLKDKFAEIRARRAQ